MSKKIIVGIVIIAVLIASLAAGYWSVNSNTGGKSITVLAAGSLAVPFQKIATKYQEKYGVKVNIETAGSIQTVKKVSELHRAVEVVAVADYHAIADYLVPNYTSWYIKFATNELVIVYTSHSKYANEVNSTNWMQILSKNDVRIGFSSPNDDPCGYRAVMMFYLASMEYHTNIFENVVLNNTGIKLSGGYINVPDDSQLLNANGRVFIKQKSVSLLADLESGNIDYAIEYKSVAEQHGLKYLQLSDDINLSNASKDSVYQKAFVKLADGKVMKGNAIVYGVTVPKNAPDREDAYRFINMLIGQSGKEILEKCGQNPIYEAYGTVPGEIKP